MTRKPTKPSEPRRRKTSKFASGDQLVSIFSLNEVIILSLLQKLSTHMKTNIMYITVPPLGLMIVQAAKFIMRDPPGKRYVL